MLATSGSVVINAKAGTLHKVIVGSTAPDFQKDDSAGIEGSIKIDGASDTVDLVVSDARGLGQHAAELTGLSLTSLAPSSLAYVPLHSLDLWLGLSGNVLSVHDIVLPGNSIVHCVGRDKVTVKVSETSRSDLIVDGQHGTDDILEVVVGVGGQTQTTPQHGTSPGVVKVTYPNGTSSVVRYLGIEHVITRPD